VEPVLPHRVRRCANLSSRDQEEASKGSARQKTKPRMKKREIHAAAHNLTAPKEEDKGEDSLLAHGGPRHTWTEMENRVSLDVSEPVEKEGRVVGACRCEGLPRRSKKGEKTQTRSCTPTTSEKVGQVQEEKLVKSKGEHSPEKNTKKKNNRNAPTDAPGETRRPGQSKRKDGPGHRGSAQVVGKQKNGRRGCPSSRSSRRETRVGKGSWAPPIRRPRTP